MSLGNIVSTTLGGAAITPPKKLQWPTRGIIAVLGSSTTERSSVTLGSGVKTIDNDAPWLWIDNLLGSRYDLRLFGYAGQTNSTILTHLWEALATNPDGFVLQLGANDITDIASAEVAFTTVQQTAETIMSLGISVCIQTPHFNGSNWAGACHYDTLCQDWGAYRGIPIVSGVNAICAQTDLVGTARSGAMADALHINTVGAQWYGTVGTPFLKGEKAFSIPAAGNTQYATEIHANPRMTGSTALTAGELAGGFSGTNKPSNWLLTRTGTGTTCAVAIGTDSEGAYMDLTIDSAAADHTIDVLESSTLARWQAGKKYRLFVDYEVISGTSVESVRSFYAFSGGTIYSPYGVSTTWTGALPVGRTMIRSLAFERDIAGATLNSNVGIRISTGAVGVTVLRIRGISARESRW